MELEKYTLLLFIKDTILYVVNRSPTLCQYGPNFISILWKIQENQDSIYEMFDSKYTMNYFYSELKSSFEEEFPNLHLDVKYCYGPIEFESQLYSQITYYYYEKNNQNTQTFFAC
jgi:hypothetical protein